MADDKSPDRRNAPYEFGFETRTIHAGARPDPITGARSTPIYQTTSMSSTTSTTPPTCSTCKPSASSIHA